MCDISYLISPLVLKVEFLCLKGFVSVKKLLNKFFDNFFVSKVITKNIAS